MKLGLTALLFLALASCADKTPTSADSSLLPVNPGSVEILLPWARYGSDFAVNGGYGYAWQVGTGTVATDYQGLNAKTLAEFQGFATDILVRDSIGQLITDTSAVIAGGRVTVTFDTLTSTVSGPLTLELGSLSQSFDPVSVTWDMRVDTTNDHEAWSQPGGGQIVTVADTTWEPGSGDSIVFNIDSSRVASLGDTAILTKGIVITAVNPGTRLRITGLTGSLNAKSKIAPDTTVDLAGALAHMTFIYSPAPPPPTGAIRVGGVPAWRTVMTITVPSQLDSAEAPALCAVVSCPMTLEPGDVNYAALILHTTSDSTPFQPTDSIGVDARQVLDPTAGPKSPLSTSLLGDSIAVPAYYFHTPGGQDIEVPITGFVRQMLTADTTSTGLAFSHTLSLMAPSEPSSIEFASFNGPGQLKGPILKLVVTTSKKVVLP